MAINPARTWPPIPVLAALALLAAGGCGTVKTTGTARSGTEQLLLTNAWDSALQKVDFRPMTGVPVYLDTTNVSAVDQGWVVSSLRQALLTQGVLLRDKPEKAQWIVEARVGAYGTNEQNWLLGIPQLSIPPTVTGVPQGTIPEIPLVKKSDQQGVAKLALFAYDRTSGQLVWSSGTMLAVATAKDVYVGGLGPFQTGSIRDGTELMGVHLPLPSEDGAPARGWRSRRHRRDHTPTMTDPAPPTTPAPAELRQAPLTTDLDAFSPP
ncbi:MAG: hypothetical protein JO329_06010 [Planctomycetaceae bacterium]|nr:hypothetical protein [Planctomycetaceae bacterium]MBV8268024.1 hypothetical protein [Planctomycetaceae bacterium]MBV8558970.1 hypothetical protein [Planctomycetaceae bacterium]MBV8605919.1 hypothetical protein [Singulisphaera sp.]